MPRRSAVHSVLIIATLIMGTGLPAFAQSQPKNESATAARMSAAVAGEVTTSEDLDVEIQAAFEVIAATCQSDRRELTPAGWTHLTSTDSSGSGANLSMEGLTSTKVVVDGTVWTAAATCSGCTQRFCRAWCMLDTGSPYGFCGPCSPLDPSSRRCWCP